MSNQLSAGMVQDEIILGYLGRALSYELSAVQQYLSLSSLLLIKGMSDLSVRFKNEAQDELQHAERIIGRIIALGFAPNASHLRPAKLNGSLSQLIEHVIGLEHEIIAFYERAVEYCIQANDDENRIFFAALLSEEKEHANHVNSLWQTSIKH